MIYAGIKSQNSVSDFKHTFEHLSPRLQIKGYTKAPNFYETIAIYNINYEIVNIKTRSLAL